MAGSFTHLFTKQAARYAVFRPSYPASLYDAVKKYGSFGDKPELAVDIATGSGQAAAELSKVFAKVRRSPHSLDDHSSAALPTLTHADTCR